MESIDNDLRVHDLVAWLKKFSPDFNRICPMPAAASTRRYFRVTLGNQVFVAMDANPSTENCHTFIAIANQLRCMGILTPEIVATNLEQGFLLLSDFGDMTYLKALTPDNANQLYSSACETLSILQACSSIPNLTLPHFNANWMWQEWAWHKEWFLEKYLKLSYSDHAAELEQCFSQIVDNVMTQPQVCMHRDYHSANLMLLPEGRVGVLDFQDAFRGPLTYDLVSLLRDCYIKWPENKVSEWACQYLQTLQSKQLFTTISEEIFLQWFDWMGIERHLKALFTFARKYVRDHQSRYLNHIPLTLQYVINVSSKYPSLSPLHDYYQQVVAKAMSASACGQ
jgi:N-acetylmuramate 1-kinase